MRMILTLILAGIMIVSAALSGCGNGSAVNSSAENSVSSDSYEAASESTVSSAVSSAGSSSDLSSAAAGSSDESSASSVSSSAGNSADTSDKTVSGDTLYLENSADGEHVIAADGEDMSYVNCIITKTGDSEGDEADFYGENSAVFAANGAVLDLADLEITTDGTHANAVFSYGEGTVVNISDSTIETSGNCSGGIMTTGGGTTNAVNLNVHTTGNSSAPIRSDRGGGTVNVIGGSYTSAGKGSPVIYSTADITVSDADLTSTSAQGVVVEGKNSVTLNNVILSADNVSKNSDKSDWYQAVMIYQSMSGDAAAGTAEFTMNGGTLTNLNGDVFFVNNTVADIALSGASITNEGGGVFLRAAAAGWGSEGSNGGHVTLTASYQTIEGDMLADSVSSLNLYLTEGSSFSGAVNPDGEEGEVYVEIEDGSVWTLTGDSYITSLTCGADAIDLNGHTLYVNGEAYESGTESTGEAIETVIAAAGPGEGQSPGNGEAPPEKPDGSSGPGGTPPEKPGN